MGQDFFFNGIDTWRGESVEGEESQRGRLPGHLVHQAVFQIQLLKMSRQILEIKTELQQRFRATRESLRHLSGKRDQMPN